MPNPNSGSGIDMQFGFEDEAVYGTIITPTRFLEFLDAKLAVDAPKIVGKGIGRGAIDRHDRTRTYVKGATLDVSFDVQTKGFAKLFRQLLGGYALTWPGGVLATGVLTFTGNAANNETVTIGAKVYTFKTTLTSADGSVLVGATAADSIANLAAAINLDGGAGVLYGALTTRNTQVTAVATSSTVLTVTDSTAGGTTANTVATTKVLANATWGAATLAGGTNGTDTERKHLITPDTRGLLHRSATAQLNLPYSSGVDSPFTGKGGKMLKGTLQYKQDEFIHFLTSWDFAGVDVATALAVASFASAAANYAHVDATLTVGGTAVTVIACDIVVDNPMDVDRRGTGNQTKREPIINGRRMITGTLDAEWEDRAAYDAWLAGTQAALVLTATGSTIPSSAQPFKCVVTLPVIEYTGEAPAMAGMGVIRQNRPFQAFYDGTNAAIQIDYRTSDTAA